MGRAPLGAETFDVDWERPQGAADTVLVPLLGEQYGAALEQGQLQVVKTDGWFRLAYFDHTSPSGHGRWSRCSRWRRGARTSVTAKRRNRS